VSPPDSVSSNVISFLFSRTGDLKTYLLARRHLVYEKSREDSDEISGRRLTSIALDVAKALSYLAELKYVHRSVSISIFDLITFLQFESYLQ
jgi:hypothetical protein